MKNPLLRTTAAAWFAAVSFARAADPADPPPWEAPAAVIVRQMAAVPAVAAIKDSAGHLSYRGGTLFGQPVQTWRFTPAASGRGPELAVRLAAVDDDADTALAALLTGKHGPPDEFRDDTRRDALWNAGPSAAFPGQTQNLLLTVVAAGRDHRAELTFFDSPTPGGASRTALRYTLLRDPHPTPAQFDAYRRIADSMDRAVRFYERWTTGIVKSDAVRLEPSEATAEGNVNGNIQFGPTDISLRTALHEMSHTVGIGTTPEFHRLTVNEHFVGKHALAQLRAITGDDHAVLHADTWHFWPYGLNNPGEDHSIWDYIHHCQMVSAILQDCRELRRDQPSAGGNP